MRDFMLVTSFSVVLLFPFCASSPSSFSSRLQPVSIFLCNGSTGTRWYRIPPNRRLCHFRKSSMMLCRSCAGNVSCTHSLVVTMATPQSAAPSKFGRMNGKVRRTLYAGNQSAASGYCRTGSAKAPATAGDTRKPQPHIPTTSDMFRASCSLLLISDTRVLMICIIPLVKPRRNRIVHATTKERRTRPNRIENTSCKASDVIKTFFLP